MSKIAFAALALVTLLAGCNTPSKEAVDKAAATTQAVPELSVTEVASALKEKRAVAVDANNAETRQKYGIVPGAVLLSEHEGYALTELPDDKSQPLVFYCGGIKCRASDKAASRAQSAGYAKVSVMREGIRGWADAGQATTTLPKS